MTGWTLSVDSVKDRTLYVLPHRGPRVPGWFYFGLLLLGLGIAATLIVMSVSSKGSALAPAKASASAPVQSVPPVSLGDGPTSVYRPTLMEIPNVIGEPVIAAVSKLEAAGFLAAVDNSENANDPAASGCAILRETPPSGQIFGLANEDLGVVGYGSTIKLFVWCSGV